MARPCASQTCIRFRLTKNIPLVLERNCNSLVGPAKHPTQNSSCAVRRHNLSIKIPVLLRQCTRADKTKPQTNTRKLTHADHSPLTATSKNLQTFPFAAAASLR